MVKTDSQGDSLWTKTFGGNEQDEGSSVQQTSDGGFVITGYTDDLLVNGGEDLFVIKTDGNGNITSTFEIPPYPNLTENLTKL